MSNQNQPATGPSPFERFSDRARKVMKFARESACELQHDYIGTEHILLGVLREGEGVGARILQSHGVDFDALRKSVLSELKPGNSAISGALPFTPRSKNVLARAIDRWKALESDYVGTEHLLLGLMSDSETLAGRLLQAALKVNVDAIQKEVKEFQEANKGQAQEKCEGGAADNLLHEISRSTTMNPIPTENDLCPRQSEAVKRVLHALPNGDIFIVWGETGLGTTTVLRTLHGKTGGAYIDIRALMNAMQTRHPLALEETIERILIENLSLHSHVYVDDTDLISRVVGNCGSHYPRSGFLAAAMTRVAIFAVEQGKKLIFAHDTSSAEAISQRAYYVKIGEFGIDDYAWFCKRMLKPEIAEKLDYKKIHRFAPKLNAYQLVHTCGWTRHWDSLDTDGMIEYLRSQRMTSNVDLGEVRPVELSELKGIDDVIRSLEANIIVPFENDKLAEELNLKPKRGVLLAGPPGTGKTTVGRALAHRLRSKFFLIDGTCIAGTDQFYGRVHRVFENAKHNAPSIIFIDDSDVIFEDGEEAGLYRYLLTMLDGLESESAGRVCVILTAMDVSNLPPALIRSGRIELWLEMRLPNLQARADILKQLSKNIPAVMGAIDIQRSAEATESFTGADLTRLIEDTKTLFAYDKAKNLPLKSTTDYLLSAVELVRGNKKMYEQCEARTRQQRPNRPPWFDVMAMMQAQVAQANVQVKEL